MGNTFNDIYEEARVCASQKTSRDILLDLMHAASDAAGEGTTATQTCDGHDWVSTRCPNFKVGLCVDCSDPCGAATATASVVLDCASGAVPSISVLAVEFEEKNPAPRVVDTFLNASRTYVTVHATLESAGLLTCREFPRKTSPTSVSEVTTNLALNLPLIQTQTLIITSTQTSYLIDR